ncbi:MAG: hypothetical protein PHY47_09685 [Lachnospiraceae bacterium]|nr:hypothetical protein [Lachnospiraceae bacterium]
MNILEIGEQKGRELGLREGLEQVKKVNELNKKLVELNRVDDILKSSTDEEYQQKLFEELGI